jgi:hypothetical protein
MAQEIAICSQRAAHRKAWENRESDLDLITEREMEAVWQLKQIVSELLKGFHLRSGTHPLHKTSR